MTMRKKTITAILASATLAIVTSSATASTYHHVDELALRLTQETAELFREFRIHYRHTAEYRHLISDAREMRSHAWHIHEVAHRQGSPAHLANDLRELDRLFHHLENVVGHVERAVHCEYRSGHVHGETSHVARLMRAIDDDIHHLRSDIAAMVPPAFSPRQARRISVPVPVPPVYGRSYGVHSSHTAPPVAVPFPRMVFRFGH